jgi:hypothetical protein
MLFILLSLFIMVKCNILDISCVDSEVWFRNNRDIAYPTSYKKEIKAVCKDKDVTCCCTYEDYKNEYIVNNLILDCFCNNRNNRNGTNSNFNNKSVINGKMNFYNTYKSGTY